MNSEEAKYLNNKIDDEGFDYCFNLYSDFTDIEDEKFHELRLAYKRAASELEKYINDHLEDEMDEDD